MFRQPLSVLLWIIHTSQCSRWPVHRPAAFVDASVRRDCSHEHTERESWRLCYYKFRILFFYFTSFNYFCACVVHNDFMMLKKIVCCLWPHQWILFNWCYYLAVKLERNGVYMHYRKRPYRLDKYFDYPHVVQNASIHTFLHTSLLYHPMKILKQWLKNNSWILIH